MRPLKVGGLVILNWEALLLCPSINPVMVDEIRKLKFLISRSLGEVSFIDELFIGVRLNDCRVTSVFFNSTALKVALPFSYLLEPLNCSLGRSFYKTSYHDYEVTR